MRLASSLLLLGLPATIIAAACSASTDGSTFGEGGSSSETTSATATTSSGDNGAGGEGAGDIGFDGGPTGAGGGGIVPCSPLPNEDHDHDGVTVENGDCNDCDPNVGPNAIEVIYAAEGGEGGAPPEPVDEDCDGLIDEAPDATCDTGFAIDDPNPLSGAKAAELCKKSSGPTDWGVVEAQWVMPDGQPPPSGQQLLNFHLGHGLLSGFGEAVNVQAGATMLALSSGSARDPADPGYQSPQGFDKMFSGGHPQGFPKESPACPGTLTGSPHDGAALEVSIRTPANAQGFSFDFNFYTFEWPNYVCSQFNDFFVALLSPFPDGQLDGNISFDSQGNPVSVNNAFVEVCGCGTGSPPAPPGCSAGGKLFTCSLGNSTLMGTGFGSDTDWSDHGSTYWLKTQAPVAPNSLITLRWGVYDSGDGVLDSTTLIDNFQWIATPGTNVGTNPTPDPH
jgi:hypothetical protein